MRALVIGGGSSVWDDLAALEALMGRPWDGIVVAANDVGVHWPHRLDVLVSLHPDKLGGWVQQRAKAGRNAPEVWSRHNLSARFRDMGIRPAKNWGGGSSGMLAVAVATEAHKARKVVLCGVPMTPTPHFAESTVHHKGKRWSAAASHWKAWLREAYRMRGMVRSMSGRTRELLGGPTMRWLEEEA